jgi:hypothetical protein
VTKASEREMDETWIRSLVQTAQHQKWYGTMSIKFEAGKVKVVRKEEVLLAPTSKPAQRTR